MASSSMMTIIKNNQKLLNKRDRLKFTLGGYHPNKKTEYNLPKATDAELHSIATRLKKERKIRMMKVGVVTGLLTLGLVIFMFKFLN
ncbi:MAG: hypothetical protein HRU50_09080 [Winogradskyella sp.]|uniref:hypothetical protein n=1 Tax=Winogradskyella sp. TaxID=1883156 RepID=UPI0025EDC50E|nr:hypothetical protein [Winogradskyella sp.]NRB60071.1 hypothetical protein [Winogradskyella sp.]